jgi:hypothetical protein
MSQILARRIVQNCQMPTAKTRIASMNGIDAVQFLLILGLHESLARTYDNIISRKCWGNAEFFKTRYLRATGITPEERHEKRLEAEAKRLEAASSLPSTIHG